MNLRNAREFPIHDPYLIDKDLINLNDFSSMRRHWLASYPEDVPDTIDINQYSSILDILTSSCKRFAYRSAFSNFGTEISYEKLNQQTQNFACYLQNQLGIRSGDRVGIMMPNILQYPIVVFAILRIGGIVVNIDPLFRPRELTHQLNDSGVETLIFVENFADTVEKSVPNTKVKNIICTQIGDGLTFPKSLLVNSIIKYFKKGIPGHNLKNIISYNEAIKSGKNRECRDAELNHNSIAFLQYTGGTTGKSKAAILTHGNIVANVLQMQAWVNQHININQQEVFITALPLYHIFSLTANCILNISIGGNSVFITDPRNYASFVKVLKREKFSVITGVNTLLRKLLDTPGFNKINFNDLRLTLAAGMAVTNDVAEDWQIATGNPIIQAYGLTETSPAASMNPLDMDFYNGKVGLPIPATNISIKDEYGNDLEIGEIGEICIKGPQVTQGYWQHPELNKTAFTNDGFFRSGDIGVFDEKGYLEILDRKKDMILVSGFNVFPNEIEDVICNHPGVAEAAAIGIPDSIRGEQVKLFLVKSDQNLTKKDVISFCNERLTGYKIPSIIEFIEELPKSTVGKILRNKLRSQ